MARAFILLILLIASSFVALGQNTQAPQLILKDLKGRTVRLSEYQGKVVLINFWATWCPPCRAEMPELIKLQQEYRDNGLQIIGITYPPQRLREVRRFVRSLKINYPIFIGTLKTASLFNTGETLPVTIVIDRQGVVRDKIIGILEPEEFEQQIRPLLQ